MTATETTTTYAINAPDDTHIAGQLLPVGYAAQLHAAADRLGVELVLTSDPTRDDLVWDYDRTYAIWEESGVVRIDRYRYCDLLAELLATTGVDPDDLGTGEWEAILTATGVDPCEADLVAGLVISATPASTQPAEERKRDG